MAIEGARELGAELSAIKKGKPRGVYVVFGTEPYLVRTAAEALVEALAEGVQAEVVRVDAEKRNVGALLEPVASLSLFASTKIVVARNFAHLLMGDSADQLLAGLDAGLGEGSALVFTATASGPADKIDKRVKGYKGLAKRGAIIELNTQKPEHLAQWLRDKAAEEGKKLTPDAAMLLLSRVGAKMEILRMELEKAILYCLDRDTIGAKDLEKLVGKSREDAVWDVSEAVAQRDPARAMNLIEDLLATGTYPLVLLTLLIRQTRHLLQARLLWEEADRPGFRDIGSFRNRVSATFESGAFGGGADDVTTIHPFAMFKRFEAAQDQEVDGLRSLLGRMRRADREAKTGEAAGAREVLEELVLDLCSRPSGGRRAA